MKNSKIEWCDHTFNPWIGCTKVSPGCAHCYAEAQDHRWGHDSWGPGKPRRRTSVANWAQPLMWDREAARDAHELASTGNVTDESGEEIAWRRPRAFCASLADWLDDEVPIEWLCDLLDLIRRTPNLDWLLLTKRPENWESRIKEARNFATTRNFELALWLNDWLPPQPWAPGCAKTESGLIEKKVIPPANVWIGTTVEDQKRADERIPALLKIPARVRFLSCEPLLGAVYLGRWVFNREEIVEYVAEKMLLNEQQTDAITNQVEIHWVICGGESGAGARPMHPDWARSLRDQCAAAGVPFFFKQWGEWIARSQYLAPRSDVVPGALLKNPKSAVMRRDGGIDEALGDARTTNDSDSAIYRVGKQGAGRRLDGVEHNTSPAL